MYSIVLKGARITAPGSRDMPLNAIAFRTPSHSSCTVGINLSITDRGMMQSRQRRDELTDARCFN